MKRALDLAGLGLVLVSFAVTAAMYAGLPDPMPSHWNVHGQADGWMPKFWGAFLTPLIMAALWLFLRFLPRLSPRGFEMEPFAKTWEILRFSILGFLLVVLLCVLFTARSGRNFPNSVLIAGMGLLFVVIGNFLGKVTRNFFVGIRTPWTLANEEVWYRTHRLGGKLFVAAGLVVFAMAFVGFRIWAMIAAILVAALVPAVYSYVIYRKLEGAAAGASTGSGR